jgi:hypothetical protein
MASADGNPKDSVLRELNDTRSELTEALDTVETELEAPRKKPQLESTVLQLNCWSGGSNTVSSACWEGNRAARLRSSRLRAPRRCAQRQRSRLTAGAATCPLYETSDYLMD